eukprot:3435911-Prymnesium_polylepis.1
MRHTWWRWRAPPAAAGRWRRRRLVPRPSWRGATAGCPRRGAGGSSRRSSPGCHASCRAPPRREAPTRCQPAAVTAPRPPAEGRAARPPRAASVAAATRSRTRPSGSTRARHSDTPASGAPPAAAWPSWPQTRRSR